MRTWLDRISPLFSVLALGIVGGLAVWAQTVLSEKRVVVLVCSLVYFALVFLWEHRWRTLPHRAVAGHRVFVRAYFLGMGLVFLFGPGSDLLQATFSVDSVWVSRSHRVSGLLFGIVLALWGNFLPKLRSPWRLEEEPFDWQGVHRFNGWVFALAGAVVFLGWLLRAPHDANRIAALAVMTAAVLGVGRKLHSAATWRSAQRS